MRGGGSAITRWEDWGATGEFGFWHAEFMLSIRGARVRKEAELEVWMVCKVKGMDGITSERVKQGVPENPNM